MREEEEEEEEEDFPPPQRYPLDAVIERIPRPHCYFLKPTLP